MSIADELEKLRKLHASGAITDEEFARAKEAAIRNPDPIPILLDDEYRPQSEAEAGLSKWYLRSMFIVPIIMLIFLAIFAMVALPKFRQGQENLEKYRREMERREEMKRGSAVDVIHPATPQLARVAWPMLHADLH